MERKIVIPGEELAEGDYKIGDGVYRDKNKLYSSVLGLLDLKEDGVRVIPLRGKYMPKLDDFVIGTIVDIEFSNWYLDINSAYSAVLNAGDYFRDIDPFQADISKVMGIGDSIFAKIREITPRKKVYVTMKEMGARTLNGGKLFEVTPTKVPRMIGKKGSMLSMIKKETGCNIVVGQNGMIWLDGKFELMDLATKVVKIIEEEAHTTGLTERIKSIIIKESEKI